MRSPIFVHVNNILSGITTIRAANMETILRKEYFAQNNYHTRAVGAFMFINRWLGVRLDWVATAFVYIAVFSCIMLKELKFLDTDSGKAGLMFVYLVQLVGLFQWTIRQSCEVENLVIIPSLSLSLLLKMVHLLLYDIDDSSRKSSRVH